MTIKTIFDYGETVYLKTDPHQQERIITAITYRGGSITYELSICEITSWHSDVELTREFDELKKLELGE
jgi:hypothetical protein